MFAAESWGQVFLGLECMAYIMAQVFKLQAQLHQLLHQCGGGCEDDLSIPELEALFPEPAGFLQRLVHGCTCNEADASASDSSGAHNCVVHIPHDLAVMRPALV